MSANRQAVARWRCALPAAVTLLRLAAGLTAIRLAAEDRPSLAFWLVLLAAALDWLDGSLARALRATSRQGAMLDSLADAVAFGVAPGLVLWHTWLAGEEWAWLAVLLWCMAVVWRLARAADGDKTDEHRFAGVPAPAGACLVLAPLVLDRVLPLDPVAQIVIATSALIAVSALVASRLPTVSVRSLPRSAGIATGLVLAAGGVGLLLVPWHTLLATGVLYLASLPIGAALARRTR